MHDRALLELAAKAAGITDGKWSYDSRTYEADCIWSETLFDSDGTGYWNPLIDDGDALRLAVKLGIAAEFSHDQMRVSAWSVQCTDICQHYSTEDCGTDPYAATRRAIVRAAAEIGKSHV